MSDLTKLPSLEDLMAAVANIEGNRSSAVPDVDDLYDSAESGNYTKWRMPPNTRSALVSSKVDPARGASLSWSKPGDYKQSEKLYCMVGGNAQEVFPTDIIGTLLDVEIRPSRRGNHGEPPSSSVIGVCRDGKCMRRLPSVDTGIIGAIYEYSDRPDLRNTQPSKELASLKWKPVTPDGLLEDIIRSGRSTATVLDKDGKEEVVAFENRGMAYMYVTHIAVRTSLPSDADGNPSIPKMMNKEEALANLITTERRVDKKVYKSYSTVRLYSMSELMDENGEALSPMFLALNMSNGAMKSNYNGGLASVSRYLMSILNGKGLKAPLDRTLSEAETNTLRTINEMGFYKRPSAWTTIMSLGMKEVQPGTFYSAPHFEGFDILGSSLYEGKQHETWGDSRKINSLNVTYLSDALRDKLSYDPTTSAKVKAWDKALLDAGFESEPEEFTLASLASTEVSNTPPANRGYTDVSYTAISSPSAGEYFTEGDDPDEDLYQ